LLIIKAKFISVLDYWGVNFEDYKTITFNLWKSEGYVKDEKSTDMDYYIDFLVSYEELFCLCDMMTSNNLCISIIEKLINVELDTKHIIPFLERLSNNFKDGKFIHYDTYEKIREIFILNPEIREMIRMEIKKVEISESDNIQTETNIKKLLPYANLANE